MSNQKAAVVLAAGKGKRMKSDLPKVLHEINGRPMILRLLDTLKSLSFDKIVVVIGHEGELLRKALADEPVEFVWQREQLGTGHAVMMAESLLANFEGTTLVAAGDVPYLSAESISSLMHTHEETAAAATCLSAIFDDPSGYGRIVRDETGQYLADIIEHKDASDKIREIREINSGTFCFDNQHLFATLKLISNDNSQGEYYLTDAVKILHCKGLRVSVLSVLNPDEVKGINSVEQLEQLAQRFR